jgi:FAD/FMN-containing dehydrogenase
MAPYFTNNSCNPFSDSTASCTMGNYAEYSVDARSASHFQMAIRFAKEHNLRLVIRNTAHDYNGKSTGAGSLALWVQHMKTKEHRHYNSTTYRGESFRFGAGVMVQEAYEFADAHNMTVVGANQGTVGLVGGYTQGGGHGPLASQLGLAADQVLEWEVVLASGEIVIASASSPKYRDLYWALCGGGGGTFGAVVSVTVKAHSSRSLSTASLSFSLPLNASESDTAHFFEVVNTFNKQIPTLNDAGAVAIWFITAQTFTLSPLFGPGLTPKALDTLLQPVLVHLQALNINATYQSEQHTSFLTGFTKQPSVQVSNLNIGGRFIPRRLIDTNTSALTSAIRNITAQGAIFSGVSFNVSMHAPDSVAANPHWRDAAFDAVIATPFDWSDWSKSIAGMDLLTESLLPVLEHLTPGGGAYLNEADFQQKKWKETFYGDHYERLDRVKRKYDPEGTFYALGAVGSERWGSGEEGRLCRV